jgi:hypothetical protein
MRAQIQTVTNNKPYIDLKWIGLTPGEITYREYLQYCHFSANALILREGVYSFLRSYFRLEKKEN